MTNQKLKIALLCNNKMAVPAMQRMMNEGKLCAVATPGKDPEVIHLFGTMCGERKVPYTIISQKGHVAQLRDWLLAAQPDIVFVITFPWRITPDLLALPRLGFLNFHFGLLPEMRGADPIFESIRQRLPAAGATVHVMDTGLDTGPIVLREEFPLSPDFTYGMLSGQMAWVGDKMCGDVLARLASPRPPFGENSRGQGEREMLRELSVRDILNPAVQDESKAKYWPKISEADVTLRWDKMELPQIVALVRSNNPISKGVPTSINGWKIGVIDVCEVTLQGDASAIVPGTIIAIDNQNGLIVCCSGGKAVKLEVVYTGEGFFPGYKLAFFGIQQGMVFSG